MNEAVSYQVA